MIRTKIQFVSKSHSLIGDPIFIDNSYVPRAGELIEMSSHWKFHHTTFMVSSVVHLLTEEGFMPLITAIEWYKGFRHEFLENRGWLPTNDPGALEYDEEDPALDNLDGS